MRILVVALSASEIVDEIMSYAYNHGIDFGSSHYAIYDTDYSAWRITCEPSKQVDMLLLRYSDYVVVY
jgi:hypothetical protein